MSMYWDLGLQALIFAIGIIMYLWLNDDTRRNIHHRYLTFRHRKTHLARRHFVTAAQLLATARSHPPSSPLRASAAASAVSAADAAVSADPSDAANHILRALALDLQGFKASALQSLDAALSPLAVGSLTPHEKADALVKRARMRVEIGKKGDESVLRVAVDEVKEAVELNRECGAAWSLLGECYRGLGDEKRADDAFDQCRRLESVAASVS